MFRASIFRLDSTIMTQAEKESNNTNKSIVGCLQRIFYNLQVGMENVRTYELLKAFGYTDSQLKIQQDASEF